MKNIPVKYLFIFSFALIISACKQNNADESDTVTGDSIVVENHEPKIQPENKPVISAVKKIVNSRFSFSFEIPSQWKAVDKSNNGDGFYITTGSKDADVRIYGEELKGNEIAAEMELQTCEKTEKYVFRNGYPGTKCLQSNDEYYYYDTPDVRIVCFVHATSAWKKENATALDAMVRSIQSGSENFQ